MATPPAPLKAVTLTHVRYEKGDGLGHILAWVSLIPVFMSLGFASHFIFRREIQTILFALGLVVSQIISELVKGSVQQARPATCALLEMCDSHGWPSSHSQYMFFFAAYFTLLLRASRSRLSEATMMALAAWSAAFLTLYSRVYLGYHTAPQVIAGATLGASLGGAWFWVVNHVLFCYFDAIEESGLGRRFCVRDTSHIDNVHRFEYEAARAAKKKRSIAKSD